MPLLCLLLLLLSGLVLHFQKKLHPTATTVIIVTIITFLQRLLPLLPYAKITPQNVQEFLFRSQTTPSPATHSLISREPSCNSPGSSAYCPLQTRRTWLARTTSTLSAVSPDRPSACPTVYLTTTPRPSRRSLSYSLALQTPFSSSSLWTKPSVDSHWGWRPKPAWPVLASSMWVQAVVVDCSRALRIVRVMPLMFSSISTVLATVPVLP